jgi:hypothetical protein
LDMWNTGSQPVDFHADWPCRAQDENGSRLKSSGLTEGERSTEDAFMIPLEPGEERIRYIPFDLPKDNGEVEIICSLAYLAGDETPPPSEQASWIINPTDLS